MAYELKLEQFEGPLSLLLRLVEQEQLEITEVSLAKVTEDYLKYLDELEKRGQIAEEEMADFLVIAAKLLYIKSKALLPDLNGVEEEGSSLEDQLKMYKEFFEASKNIEQIIKKKKFAYFREVSWRELENGFYPPKGLKKEKIKIMFEDILERLKPIFELPRVAMEKTISIREKIGQIETFLLKATKIGFRDLLEKAQNRTEIIITFLAILELTKQRQVTVHQEINFENILIEKI